MVKPDYIEAHKHCTGSRKEIEQSDSCGCFNCLALFRPAEISEWWDDEYGAPQTPVCPNCGIDSVIGDKSGYPITKEFLGKMNKYWFSFL